MSTFGVTGRKAKPFNTSAGTHTRDGFEPHLKLMTMDGSLTLYAPVRVNPPLTGEVLPRAQKDREGRKLYALPGGLQVAV
jgi:hypothetical protein